MKPRHLAFSAFLSAGLTAISAQAGVIYQFVCIEPAGCGADMDFRFTVELDASVITPNGTYTTGSDGGAGFLGWTGSSSIGNGFSANGTLKHVSGTKSHLGFSFDENGVINGIYTTEHTANDPLEPSEDDTVDFSVPGAGKITWSETQQVVSRADQACPPDPPGHFCVNNKPIKGEWHKVGGPGG